MQGGSRQEWGWVGLGEFTYLTCRQTRDWRLVSPPPWPSRPLAASARLALPSLSLLLVPCASGSLDLQCQRGKLSQSGDFVLGWWRWVRRTGRVGLPRRVNELHVDPLMIVQSRFEWQWLDRLGVHPTANVATLRRERDLCHGWVVGVVGLEEAKPTMVANDQLKFVFPLIPQLQAITGLASPVTPTQRTRSRCSRPSRHPPRW